MKVEIDFDRVLNIVWRFIKVAFWFYVASFSFLGTCLIFLIWISVEQEFLIHIDTNIAGLSAIAMTLFFSLMITNVLLGKSINE